ncbi:MAG: isoaspartyl peptidase/L-asparaginase [Bacteroidota bacterium]
MRYIYLLLILGLMSFSSCDTSNAQENPKNKKRPEWALVIHGGAGYMSPDKMEASLDKEYRDGLAEALDAGERVLANGGSAEDAVVATIQVMEANPRFNSAVGAVLTMEGKAELDASFMSGNTRNSGAVAGVTNLKSPIAAARLVMDSSKHVMMAGRGAEVYAMSHGLDTVPNSYFITDRRMDQFNRKINDLKPKPDPVKKKYGTVGCAALDKEGNLAAGTSTGGMMFKEYGRVGDAPIIGAGTYADNNTCAVSCTGHGEYFIRNVVAYDVAARMGYLKESLKDAADYIINDKLVQIEASGGLIAIDKEGNVAMPFNSSGMFRGYRKSTGENYVGIYKDE